MMQALSYLDEDVMMQLEGHYLDQAHAVKVPIHLNMAACQLRIGDNNTAIYNCTEVRVQLHRGCVYCMCTVCVSYVYRMCTVCVPV